MQELQRLFASISSSTPVAVVDATFQAISEQLFYNTVLRMNDETFRLIEFEFYLLSDSHPDQFTHAAPLQKQCGKWYFHQKGKSFVGGSFKGVDITFGDESVFGGILLRAIENVHTGSVIEGPSLLVDKILTATGSSKIADLLTITDVVSVFASLSDSAAADDTQQRHAWSKSVFLDEPQADERLLAKDHPIISCPRVGLTLLKKNQSALDFLMKHLRFLIHPASIKKARQNTIVGMYAQGYSADEIAKLLRSKLPTIHSYIAWVEAGRSLSPLRFLGKSFNNEQYCNLYGALLQRAADLDGPAALPSQVDRAPSADDGTDMQTVNDETAEDDQYLSQSPDDPK